MIEFSLKSDPQQEFTTSEETIEVEEEDMDMDIEELYGEEIGIGCETGELYSISKMTTL